jgi:hypothetical protein
VPARHRPIGQITRGKTAPNRLRQTDVFLAVAYPERLAGPGALYVDLGYGAYPVTTLETLQRLRRVNPDLQVLGVEIDPARVAEAEPFAAPGLAFRLGGFDLPLRPGERPRVVRAFNVLRQYAEAECEAALRILGASLAPGGLVIEGTCDPPGRLLTFDLHERGEAGLRRLAFVLAPRLRGLGATFDPRSLRAILPKRLIHHAEPGGPIDAFFAAWHRAWLTARSTASEPRQCFTVAAQRLAGQHGYPVDLRPRLLRRGFLCLGPEFPEPRAIER